MDTDTPAEGRGIAIEYLLDHEQYVRESLWAQVPSLSTDIAAAIFAMWLERSTDLTPTEPE